MKTRRLLAMFIAILMVCTAVNFVPAISVSAKTVNHQSVSASDEEDTDYSEDDSDYSDGEDDSDSSGDEDDNDSSDGEDDSDSGDEDSNETEPEEKDTVYTEAEMKTDLANMKVSQSCGESLLWYITGTTLVIFGNGNMYNYSETNPAPWKNCKFDNVVFRNGVESVGYRAFYNSNVKSITFSSTIKEIGDSAFERCYFLVKVHLNKGLEKLGQSVFKSCTALKEFTFNNTITKIGLNCFQSTGLNSITFPKTIQEIPFATFRDCTQLKTVILKEGLQVIDTSAFDNCRSLTKVQVPSTLGSIGICAFEDCVNLCDIDLSNAVSVIEHQAFKNCKALKELNLGKVVDIGSNAFWESGLTKVTVSKYLTHIEEDIFEDCPRVTVDVKENAIAYKYFQKLPNVDVVCKVHSNHSFVMKKASFNSDGKINGSICDACGYETAVKTIYQIKCVNLSDKSVMYNGKNQYPVITVKDRNKKTIAPSNYDVTFSKGFKNVGTYSIKLKFKNNYTGTKTVYFKINPPKTGISYLVPKSKGFTLKIKKKNTEVSGYQAQISKRSGFAPSNVITLPKSSNVKKDIKKLISKKKYYVRVRTYKMIGKTMYTSEWSKPKSVITK